MENIEVVSNIDPKTSEEVRAYWTEEKMKEVKPLPMPVVQNEPKK